MNPGTRDHPKILKAIFRFRANGTPGSGATGRGIGQCMRVEAFLVGVGDKFMIYSCVLIALFTTILSGWAFGDSPTANMRLIFDDEFGEASLSPQKWLLGVNLNNQQWGSDSYFVTRSDTNLYPLVYIVSGGILTIRANYDPNFVDPTHWGRHWYSGMIIPLGADGTAASATFRRGCYEIREKLPAGKGVWPANWAVNLAAQTNGNSSGGSVELDGLESYGAFPHNFNSTVHLWTTPPQYDMRIIKTPDLTADFHIYTFCNDDTKFSTYLDGVPVSILPIYRPDTVDKFFWMTNLAMGGGWPITVPPSGHYDMEITYVRVYSAD